MDVKELIKDYILEEKIAPGISYAVLKNGECIDKRSYGYSNIENKVMISSKTNFYLASISKTFTGAAIMLLHQNGKLNINDKISKYFSNLPKCYDNIRIINLLNHTSGLKDYFGDLLNNDKLYNVTNEDVYKFFVDDNNLKFPVGSEFEYTNTGYTLLSIIVERVSGDSFHKFLRENFFIPLGMKNTYIFTKDRPIIPNRAYGYKEKDGEYRCDDYSILTYGDGGIYSSIDDLILWNGIFYNNKIFSKNILNMMFTTDISDAGINIPYNSGWFVKNRKGKKIVFHDGSAFGFRTFFGKSIDDDFTIIFLTNCYKDKMWKEIYNRASLIILEMNDCYSK